MTISLVMGICAIADFVGSATLVAVTVTIAVEGRPGGAVNTPLAVIVPVAALPPETPFTLQVTLVLFALVTLAANAWELPNRTDAVVGETETLIAAGGGGGADGGATAPPVAAQPVATTPVATARENGNLSRRPD